MSKFLKAWTAILICLSVGGSATAGPNDDYDRLDGRGESGAKVNVIEWEKNLEVHVYPAGMIKSLAMKLDKAKHGGKVMVIGYRFISNPAKQLIRRAVLGIEMNDGFRVYRDPRSGNEYDKFVVTNLPAEKGLVAYQLEAPPAQLYPDGHENLRLPASRPEQQPTSRQEDQGGIDPDSGAIRSKSW